MTNTELNFKEWCVQEGFFKNLGMRALPMGIAALSALGPNHNTFAEPSLAPNTTQVSAESFPNIQEKMAAKAEFNKYFMSYIQDAKDTKTKNDLARQFLESFKTAKPGMKVVLLDNAHMLGDAETKNNVVSITKEWIEQLKSTNDFYGAADLASTFPETKGQAGDLQRMGREWATIQKNIESLKTNPDNKPANTYVGNFLTFSKGDWQNGLPYLAKGSDAALAKLAQDTINAKSTQEKLAIADSWMEMGNKQFGASKEIMKQHAVEAYKQIVDDLSGLDKMRVEKIIDDNTKEFKYEIDASKDWQKTIAVKSGDIIEITANGKWTSHPSLPNTDGDGGSLKGNSNAPIPNTSINALVCRINDKVMIIGKHKTINITSGGTLELRINDSQKAGDLNDNRGSLSINIKRLK